MIDNILFALLIISIALIVSLIYGLINQYENFVDVDYGYFINTFANIHPLNYKSGDIIVARTIGKAAHYIRSAINREYNHVGLLIFGQPNITRLCDIKSGNVPYMYHTTPSDGSHLRKLYDYAISGKVEWFKIIRIPWVKSYHRHIIKKFICDSANTNYNYLSWEGTNTHNCISLVNKFYKDYIKIPIMPSDYNVDPYILSTYIKKQHFIHAPKDIGIGYLNIWTS